MLQDSVSSTWESMANWFTPTVLFIILNLMIATIAFTSSLANQKSAKNAPRSTNLSILNRLKSASFHSHQHHTQNPDSDPFYDGIESHTQYLFQQNTITPHDNTQIQDSYSFVEEDLNQGSIGNDDGGADFSENNPAPDEHTLDEIFNQMTVNQINKKAEPEPGRIQVKLNKSASLKLDFGHSDEKEDVLEKRRPMTVREKGSSIGVEVVDEEVDARAADFINKFKHQLKLQRLDSILKAGTKM